MTQIANSLIEDLCEHFESEWSRENCDATGILRFLSQRSIALPCHPRLLSELIKISVERSWMAWDKRLPSMVDGMEHQELLAEFMKIPRLDSYQSLFASPEDFESSLQELVLCELLCRDLWGDAIGVPHFNNLGMDLSFCSSGKQRKVRCAFDNEPRRTASVFPLRGCTQIGRQRSTDTQDCACAELKDGNRIVIAGWAENEISRVQLAIQLLNPAYAIVTNLSQINPMQVYDRILQPTESMVSIFPFAIQLPGRKLHCN